MIILLVSNRISHLRDDYAALVHAFAAKEHRVEEDDLAVVSHDDNLSAECYLMEDSWYVPKRMKSYIEKLGCSQVWGHRYSLPSRLLGD